MTCLITLVFESFPKVIEGLLANLDLTFLQKIFYLLSINLLLLGTFRFFVKAKNETKALNLITSIEKTTKTIDLSLSPEKHGEDIGKIIMLFKKGGSKVKKYMSTLSKTQIISLVIMFASAVVGVLFVAFPQLAPFEEAVYAVGVAFGGSSFVGAFAVGKNSASQVKLQNKGVKSEIKEFKKKLAVLEIKYKPVKDAFNDVQELGGELTSDQRSQYNTYLTQKTSLEGKIKLEQEKLDTTIVEPIDKEV